MVAANMPMDVRLEVSDWIAQFGLVDPPENWVIRVTLSNSPIEHWFYKRNKLKPESLWLDLTVPAYGLWHVQLDRHDGLFQVQWRANDDQRVESQQLKYRRLVAWPRLNGLNGFPRLAMDIEQCLGVHFLRHANVGARMLSPKTLLENGGFVRWISPCADAVGQDMRS